MPDRIGPLFRRPVVVAPMAGATTTSLVLAATGAGAMAFLAGGYRTAAGMRADIDEVRRGTDEAFGVNVFLPGSPTSDHDALDRYIGTLGPEADRLGTALGTPSWDDDDWPAKLAVLVEVAPPLVSFTFGCPTADMVGALHDAGSAVAVTVTGVGEAAVAAGAGADCLVVQGSEAGAHRGTFANDDGAMEGQPLLQLLPAVVTATGLPVIAAGGVMDADHLAAALTAGAQAVQCGTAFLRCPESGAHPVHKDALVSGRYHATTVTRAFSGRPARGLVNRFMVDHPDAPVAYPEVNNATRPLRSAAARAGDPDRMSLWAGTGFARATDLPAAEVVERLTPRS